MPIYLDHNATTPLDPRVLDAMLPYLSGPYGNASSVHRYGRAARDAIEAARGEVAALVDCAPAEVVFTSGATESNNLALRGVAEARPGRVLYGATEHPAVLEAAEALRAQGRAVEVIAMQRDGGLDAGAFAAQLAQGPVALVALMLANNETGVVQDTAAVAGAVHAAGGWLHVDAVQAAGKLAFTRDDCGADLLSLSAHKLYGPKGIGALVVRPEVEFVPQMHGGGQEKGRRGGTENLAAIVGFGAACRLAQAERETRIAHALALRERLEAGLAALGGMTIFGAGQPRLANTVQVGVAGWEGEALLMALDRHGIAVSSGSACASGRGEPSHVLLGMGWDRDTAYTAVRISLGVASTEAEIDRLLAVLGTLRAQVAA